MNYTKFQRTLVADKDTLWEIVKLFHPDIPDVTYSNSNKEKITKDFMLASAHPGYTWVMIEFRVRGYGLISICLDNKDNSTLWGDRITKVHMQKALDNGDVKIKAWRPMLDKLYDKNKNYNEVEPAQTLATDLLKTKGYKVIELDEWFYHYYKD